MKKLLYTILCLSLSFHSYSQLVSGQLIRLHNVPSVVDLNNITNPLAGQLAFVISETTSYQYDGTAWIPLGGNDTLSIIIDQDRDTWVRVDNGNDNDVIDFTNQGTHHFRMSRGRLDVYNSGHSLFIGEGAGAQNVGNLSNNTGVRNVGIGHQAWGSSTGNDNVAIGYQAMMNNSGTSPFYGSVAVGARSLQNNLGGENTAVGEGSLRSNTTGIDNTACGSGALNSNTITSSNSAFGSAALFLNTGHDNSAFGKDALYNNTANGNSAFGFSAMRANTSGNNNSAFGENALKQNTTGNSNSAFGDNALTDNTTGNDNSAFGNLALERNTTGISNTAVGSGALRFNDGDNNTAVGFLSLWVNEIGNGNSAFGRGALSSNVLGHSNSAFGISALINNTDGSNNTAVGDFALGFNTMGENNVGIGRFALRVNTNGSDNCALGALALRTSLGTNNIVIGFDAQVANPLQDNQIRMGNAAIISVAIQVSWSVSSDLHWKEKVRDLPYGMNLISKLRPVDYVRKNSSIKTREVGFIAQELVQVLEEVGFDDQGFLTQTDQGHYEVRYNDFIPIAIKGIQEQQEEIEQFKTKYNQLLERIELLEKSKF